MLQHRHQIFFTSVSIATVGLGLSGLLLRHLCNRYTISAYRRSLRPSPKQLVRKAIRLSETGDHENALSYAKRAVDEIHNSNPFEMGPEPYLTTMAIVCTYASLLTDSGNKEDAKDYIGTLITQMLDMEDKLSLVEKVRIIELITQLAEMQESIGAKDYAERTHTLAMHKTFRWFSDEQSCPVFPPALPTRESLLSDDDQPILYKPDPSAPFIAYAGFCEREGKYNDAVVGFKLAGNVNYGGREPNKSLKPGLEKECNTAMLLARAAEVILKSHDETGKPEKGTSSYSQALLLAGTGNDILRDYQLGESQFKELRIVREASLAVYLTLGAVFEKNGALSVAESCYKLALSFPEDLGGNQRASAGLLRIQGAREREDKKGSNEMLEQSQQSPNLVDISTK